MRLKELLEANERLATVYVLKDDLKHLWDYKYPGAARRFWDQWPTGSGTTSTSSSGSGRRFPEFREDPKKLSRRRE